MGLLEITLDCELGEDLLGVGERSSGLERWRGVEVVKWNLPGRVGRNSEAPKSGL